MSMVDANILNYQPIYMPSTNMQVSRTSNAVNSFSLTRQPNDHIVPESGNIPTPKMAPGRPRKIILNSPIVPKKTRQRTTIQKNPPIINTHVGTSSTASNIICNANTQRSPLSDITSSNVHT